MKVRIKSSIFFIRYLVSYILVFLIPIIGIVTFINSTMLSSLKKQCVRNNVNMLRRAQYITDENLKQLSVIQSNLLVNRNIRPVYNIENVNDSRKIIEELKKYTVANNMIREIGLFFKGDNFLYTSTGTYRLDNFVGRSFRFTDWSAASFQKALNSGKPIVHATENVAFFGENHHNILTVIYPIQMLQNNVGASIVFFLDAERLSKVITKGEMHPSTGFFIVDSENKVIFDNVSKEFGNLPNKTEISRICSQCKTKGKSGEVKFHKISYLASCIPSNEFSWNYILLVPVSQAYGDIVKIQTKLCLTLLILSFVGGMFIQINMAEHYRPVKKLKQYADHFHNDSTSSNGDYLADIRGTMDYLAKQNIVLKKSAASQNHAILRIIKGKLGSEEESQKLCEDIGMTFSKPLFCVLIIIFKRDKNEEAINAQKLQNEIREFMQGYLCEQTEKNSFVYLANISSYEHLCAESTLHSMHERLSKWSMSNVNIGCGRVVDNLTKVAKSYMEADIAIDYRFVKGNNCVIKNSDLIMKETEEQYPRQLFEQLNYHLRQGDAHKLEIIFDKISSYLKNSDLPLFYAKMLCYQLINNISDILSDLGSELCLNRSELSYAASLSDFETVDELINVVRNICLNACTFICSDNEQKENDLAVTIKQYIQNHYTDSNFSIRNMADSFDMTLTSISHFFKIQCGITIMDYVTRIRMERAKELLLETDLSLNDIVLKIGYTNASSFIRRFKQLNGVTPGQFTKLNRTKNKKA